ncbi:MAG: hypothetical protein WC821_05295 [archaeon]|jgi:hypothetical protein
MVEIYASWTKGLPEDKEALAILKNSGIIAGIELCKAGNEIELIKNSGLKYNLHNALRDYKLGLDSQYFVPAMVKFPEVLKACRESDPPAIGFHTGYSSLEDKMVSKEGTVATTLKSIRFLDEKLNKKVIFESTCYHERYFSSGHQGVANYVTSPIFFKEILSRSKAGFLFDVSHNLVSGTTKIIHKEYKGEISDYFREILNVVAKETYQMHLNVPSGDHKVGYNDMHLPLKMNQKNSKLVLLLAKEVLDSCPNLKTLTLELNPIDASPKHHAKMLVEQAKLIHKHLL